MDLQVIQMNSRLRRQIIMEIHNELKRTYFHEGRQRQEIKQRSTDSHSPSTHFLLYLNFDLHQEPRCDSHP